VIFELDIDSVNTLHATGILYEHAQIPVHVQCQHWWGRK